MTAEQQVESTAGVRDHDEVFDFAQPAQNELPNLGRDFQLVQAIFSSGAHRSGGRPLRTHRWTDQDRILDFADRLEERLGDHHPADTPAREAISL